MLRSIARLFERLSTGAWVILALALVSTAFVVAWPQESHRGMEFWVFNKVHASTYAPFVERWNAAHPDAPVNLHLLHMDAFERRILSAFTAGTPVAPILETERRVASRSFLGPADSVGYYDLTDRLRDEGILAKINTPSLAPWTSRGRIYGIPHDVHPMLLCYRADIIEAAGIDMSKIETWDDFARVLRPLMRDLDGDGRCDRFLLSGWPNNQMFVEGLLRQGGGRYFDDNEQPVIDSDLNARLLATIITWTAAPDRICTDIPDQVASGYQMRLDGVTLCALMPDWMVGQWKHDMPGLSGKLKLMPLPAFTRGGRRTSVWGGTMLGIARSAKNFDAAWAFAKDLYLSPKLAEELFRGTGIVTPVKEHWSLPVFREPDPYFCGQPSGKLFIDEAPNVPVRSSTPFERLALERTITAALMLQDYATSEGKYTVDELFPEAKRLLGNAQAQVKAHMARNVFQPK